MYKEEEEYVVKGREIGRILSLIVMWESGRPIRVQEGNKGGKDADDLQPKRAPGSSSRLFFFFFVFFSTFRCDPLYCPFRADNDPSSFFFIVF